MKNISSKKSVYSSIGLMSGTSFDGIDLALIKTDGIKLEEEKKFFYFPYDSLIRNQIKSLINNEISSLIEIKKIELLITEKHIVAVKEFLVNSQIKNSQIDVIGFHGQTIIHSPENKITWQLGNAAMLAHETKINVVADFRTMDLVLGGNGAPLVPIYHHALFKSYVKPVLILNIGGVSNLTYLRNDNESDLIACDVCFGNAPMDDLVRAKINQEFDQDGNLAKKGNIDQKLLRKILEEDYFGKLAPKSLDRNHFKIALKDFNNLKLEGALATLSAIIAESLKITIKQLPEKPKEIIVCGGGRKNQTIMRDIELITQIKTRKIDELNINGDAIEAEAFAFLAVRNLLDLPISFQKTTGVLSGKHIDQTSGEVHPSSCGGVFYRA